VSSHCHMFSAVLSLLCTTVTSRVYHAELNLEASESPFRCGLRISRRFRMNYKLHRSSVTKRSERGSDTFALSLCGALTCAELGGMKPQAEGEYIYIHSRRLRSARRLPVWLDVLHHHDAGTPATVRHSCASSANVCTARLARRLSHQPRIRLEVSELRAWRRRRTTAASEPACSSPWPWPASPSSQHPPLPKT
jgi:hypothetical protein